MGVVAVRPGGRVRDTEAARLAARLRERESVLLAEGPWPQAEAELRVEATAWSGLGEGHGYLERCEATVVVDARHAGGLRRTRILLTGPVTAAAPMVQAAPAIRTAAPAEPAAHELAAVG